MEMLANWREYMIKDYKKIRERCRKGIPSSVRQRAWMHLCGAQFQMWDPQNKTEFKRLYVSSFCMMYYRVTVSIKYSNFKKTT